MSRTRRVLVLIVAWAVPIVWLSVALHSGPSDGTSVSPLTSTLRGRALERDGHRGARLRGHPAPRGRRGSPHRRPLVRGLGHRRAGRPASGGRHRALRGAPARTQPGPDPRARHHPDRLPDRVTRWPPTPRRWRSRSCCWSRRRWSSGVVPAMRPPARSWSPARWCRRCSRHTRSARAAIDLAGSRGVWPGVVGRGRLHRRTRCGAGGRGGLPRRAAVGSTAGRGSLLPCSWSPSWGTPRGSCWSPSRVRARPGLRPSW